VEAQRIGCHGWLAPLDSLLGILEVDLEVWPGLIGAGLVVPLADIAGEDSCATEYDESDIHKLIVGLRGVGSVSHAGVLVDGSKNSNHGFVVIIGCGFKGSLRGSERLRVMAP